MLVGASYLSCDYSGNNKGGKCNDSYTADFPEGSNKSHCIKQELGDLMLAVSEKKKVNSPFLPRYVWTKCQPQVSKAYLIQKWGKSFYIPKCIKKDDSCLKGQIYRIIWII